MRPLGSRGLGFRGLGFRVVGVRLQDFGDSGLAVSFAVRLCWEFAHNPNPQVQFTGIFGDGPMLLLLQASV